MTRRQWSLVIVLILINYLVFSQLFHRIVNTDISQVSPTRTPEATFTPSATLIIPVITPATETPAANIGQLTPTPTNTLVVLSDQQAAAATATLSALATQQARAAEQTRTAQQPNVPPIPTPNQAPLVTASNTNVNLRLGPGTNYDRSGVLLRGQSLEIIGRNANSSWWQVRSANGIRWIAASVTTASNASVAIPVAQAPPPPTSPPPTNTPVPQAPPQPPQPSYQFTIHNIFGQTNEAITQIRGEIRDSAGNPVDGIRVRVRSGSFCTVSYPSGAPGNYPAGGYDILLDNRAKPGNWQVAVVNGPADPKNTQCSDGLDVLSEEVSVPTNNLEGVVFVEWRKNF